MKTEYFLDMYAADPDPWGFGSRWYERRKYALTLACLPRERYRRVFEPGCSVGVLTELLAGRADHVDAGDLVPLAVEQARARLEAAGCGDRVGIRQWDLRDPWPDERYDLVVLSEVLYYLDADEARRFMLDAVAHLEPDGHVVVAHWQPRVPEYPLGGDEAQEIARSTPGLTVLASYRDADVTLDVLAPEGSSPSVATAEGLRDDA